ncbi:MAG: cytochrome c oxidase subunit II [Gammaproteobacteria bacterium]|nr:cytochrome c oxidase subunit II [Gammaproteobacteria bacterium]
MTFRATLTRAVAAAVISILPMSASAEWALNMRKGVTPFSNEIYDLHMLVLGICVVIGIVVFAAIVYSVINFRKSKGAVAEQWHESTKVEVVWTVIPFLILVGMAVPATKALIMMEDTAGSDMTIKVTGYQWKWGYEYVDEGITMYSTIDADSNAARKRDSGIDPASVDNYLLEVDNYLVVPTDTKIRFLTTAADVIHAWWVPDLGWKRDAIPGFINESWATIEEPGVYRGQCAELCGKDHGFMPVVIRAVPKDEYLAWVDEQKADAVARTAMDQRNWSADDLVATGEKVYQANCVACHQADGQGVPGLFPALTDSAVVDGDVSAHARLVLDGRAQTAMPSFRGQLSNAEIAAVVSYQRQRWGNGEMLQPTDVANLAYPRVAGAGE